MAKNSRIKKVTLSRFFAENLKLTEYIGEVCINESPYFMASSEMKIKGMETCAQFKGFSKKEIYSSKLAAIKLKISAIKIQDNIDSNNFLGFSKSDIELSHNLTETKLAQVDHYGKKRCKLCLGFTRKEQRESSRARSRILEKYELIRNIVYKDIDRRILSNHLETSKAKRVCSSYWPYRRKELVIKLNKFDQSPRGSGETEKEILRLKKNSRYSRKCFVKVKTEEKMIEGIEEENVSISESRNVKEEPLYKVTQYLKRSRSDGVEFQDSPFLQIKKEFFLPSFVPPKSPHNLLEEDLYHDPWALLVATIFLNKTSCKSARPYVFWFLEDNPDAWAVLGKSAGELEKYFEGLGLQKTRSVQVWRMSHDFIYKNWNNVGELYGVGRYGQDAFRMFCLGDFGVEPKDRFLKIYKAWYEMKEREEMIKAMNS